MSKFPTKQFPTDSDKLPHSKTSISYKQRTPTWKFSLFDKTHPRWGIRSAKWNKVVEGLMGYENMTWEEIETASGGKTKGSNSHFESIDGMCREARKRAEYLKIGEVGEGTQELFSLRITAQHRLYGRLDWNGEFYVLWNDVNHEVWPIK